MTVAEDVHAGGQGRVAVEHHHLLEDLLAVRQFANELGDHALVIRHPARVLLPLAQLPAVQQPGGRLLGKNDVVSQVGAQVGHGNGLLHQGIFAPHHQVDTLAQVASEPPVSRVAGHAKQPGK